MMDEEDRRHEGYRAAAAMLHHVDGEVEIDPGARVSEGDDPGAYVEAWVWVPVSAAVRCAPEAGGNDDGE